MKKEKWYLCKRKKVVKKILNITNNSPYGHLDMSSGEARSIIEVIKQMKKKPKLLIIGHARYGKDSVAEYWRDNFGLNFKSSSVAASEIFLYDTLKDVYGYSTPQDCFLDRVNHRAEWYELIKEYNKDDRAKLAKGILSTNDCYVGMRDREEIAECIRQELFDIIVWVDASKRHPPEDKSSFNIEEELSDIIIDNNGTEEQLRKKLHRIGKVIF